MGRYRLWRYRYAIENFDIFWGCYTNPLFTNEGQIWCATADPRSTFTCEIWSRSVYSVILWRQKTPIFVAFWTSALVMSPIGINLRKWCTGAQLQTFAYPTASKSFLYCNAFMAKLGTQSLTFKSMTDRQKQTKNWTFLATPAAGEIWAHGDRGPRARSCTSNTFGGLTHSFAAKGHWKFGGNQAPST